MSVFVTDGIDHRFNAAQNWLASLPYTFGTLSFASADASFRRYLRCSSNVWGSVVLMDAPPAYNDNAAFLHVAALLRTAGVTVPEVYVQENSLGFYLIQDFGDNTLLNAVEQSCINATDADSRFRAAHPYYQASLTQLLTLQSRVVSDSLARYSQEKIVQEMQLWCDWYIVKHCGYTLTDDDKNTIQAAFTLLAQRALSQPQRCKHRDYHSRNLMVLPHDRPDPATIGVIDFQDALHGPITYAAVSLLRDAYIEWPEEAQLEWLVPYWEGLRAQQLLDAAHSQFDTFYTSFEWMGLQRFLKIIGIFARLNHRDGKSHYLADIPRVQNYARAVLQRYREWTPLRKIFEKIPAPV